MEILINNQQNKVEVTDELVNLIKKVIKETLKFEKIDKSVEISLLLIDNEKIKELNSEHRGKNKSTDVLSFPLYDSLKEALDEEILYLGDIVISCEKAIEQAKEFKHSVNREIGYLTVHSVLHLLGYDHMNEEDKNVMRKKEEEILESMNLLR